ncbi:MAG: methyltransferase [Nitriliruptorales bacterium]|nr:methyltransferase [Nitriliruptorales bacterium]
MRVIAGTARGRPLKAPRGQATRPTSDRVREALFSSIAAHVPGATVLDLFAGSGALGIEALSRGAGFAVFVDDDQRAVRAITENLAVARMRARSRVVRVSAIRFCADPGAALGGAPAAAKPPANHPPAHHPPAPPFDIVLCDPPYALALSCALSLLEDLGRAAALRPHALVVIERDRRDIGLAEPMPASFEHLRDRRYGDTVLRYARLAQEPVLTDHDAGAAGEEPAE